MKLHKQILITALAIFSFNCYADVPTVDMASLLKMADEIATAKAQLSTMEANLATLGTPLNWADLNSTSA